MARPTTKTVVPPEDRAILESWLRAGKTPQKLAQRAGIILALADGASVLEVAQKFEVSKNLVWKWRARYREQSVNGLKDRPRSGRPEDVEPGLARRILYLTVERIPAEATHWSVRLMAKAAGTSLGKVRKIWQAANLKPHRLKTFKLSKDPYFAEKVIDVVGLYINPPDHAMVLSVDEKTQLQALERSQSGLRNQPGKVATRTHDYKRHGIVHLHAALNIATGRVIGRVTKRHRAREFLDFLRQIDRNTPPELDLHLIALNASTHGTPAVEEWLEEHARFHFHFTPTSASWLNAVESWFSLLQRRALHRGSHTSVTELKKELHRFVRVHNQHSAKPYVWTKSAASILASVEEARRSLRLQL